jgi:hypothetical protein
MPELDAFAAANEVSITTTRADGTDRHWRPIWVVQSGDDVFVRSWRGYDGAWYRHALRAGGAMVLLHGERVRVLVVPVAENAPERNAIDVAYRSCYGRYGDGFVGPMTASRARPPSCD